jgi:hypothetical protein
LNNQNRSRIVRAMKRTPFLLVVLALWSALPLAAQSTEFGVLVGGSRRFAEGAPRAGDPAFEDGTFSFSNSVVDLYWAINLDDDTRFKVKAGRIETTIPVVNELSNGNVFRTDEAGEIQHIEGNIEYRFSEVYGKTALFGGLGFYRQSPDISDSTNSWGFNAGVNADFPLSRRYGIVGEATYHWVREEFNPRYLTVTGGLRIAF